MRWQHQFLAGPEIAKQIAWWREQLSGPLPDLKLPSDRPRPTRSARLGDNASIALPRELADALTALGRQSGATLFMVLFAAYNVMLHRYSGQNTVLVGTPVRARNRPEAEFLIGPFVNTLVLRTSLSPELRFVDLLAQVRDTALDAFSHEDTPLERLGIRPPSVRAFFSFQDARSRPPALGAAQISQVHVEPKAAANDLMLWTMETPRELLAFMNYSSELFDAITIERFLAGFRALLRGVVRAPEASIAELPVAADGDADQQRSWGTPAGELAPVLSEQVRRWAAETGDHVAVSDGEQTLSYAELWRRARALSNVLRKLASPARVAVVAGSSLERAVALVAADLSGASVLLLDPEYPSARAQAVCAALQLDAILDLTPQPKPAFATVLPYLRAHDSHDNHEPAIERNGDELAAESVLVWVVRVDNESHVQAFPVSRAALATGASELARTLGTQPSHALLSLCAVSGELAAYQIALPLMAGATLVQPAADARIDKLAGYSNFDLVMGPASMLSRLSPRERALVDAYAVTSEATEPLAASLLSQGKRLYRVSGFAEVSLAPFAQLIMHAHEATRLGRAVFPARAVVLGPDREVTPTGVPGALWLATELSVQGGVTGERLAGWPDALPFIETGRQARFMADGALDLVPDTTQQIELSGVRVSLQELTAELLKHPSIADARVIASHTRAGSARLDAYVALQPHAPFTETELRLHLQQTLPAYALPHAYIEVDKPAELVEIEHARPSLKGESDYVAPRTTSERLLAERWSQALQLERIGVHDNFFALGGHSLLCFEVISAIEKSSGRRLGPRIMLLGTLAQVAVELDAAEVQATVQLSRTQGDRAQRDTALTGRLLQKLKDLVR